MQELEDELDTPTGISTIKAPELNVTGVLVSQDCGILYEIQKTTGMKYVFLHMNAQFDANSI